MTTGLDGHGSEGAAAPDGDDGAPDADGVAAGALDADGVGVGALDADGVAIGDFDAGRVARAVREILYAIGEDPDRDGLIDTPSRVARMYGEIFSGLYRDPRRHLSVTFEAQHDEMVMVKDIDLYSVCEHHLVPWFGVAHVAYIPGLDGRITGLSKLARLVEDFARRPQVQERLTTQVADAIEETLEPRGVLVVVEAEHFCMSMRGVRKPRARTVTSAVRGVFRESVATRSEAMGFIHGSR